MKKLFCLALFITTCATAQPVPKVDLGSPGPIGITTPSSGKFTSLNVDELVIDKLNTFPIPAELRLDTAPAGGSGVNFVIYGGQDFPGKLFLSANATYPFIGAAFGSSASNSAFMYLLGSGVTDFRGGQGDVSLFDPLPDGPQTIRIFNTYTSATDYECLAISWSSNVVSIKPLAAGNGTVRPVRYYYTATVFDSAGTGSPESSVVAGIGSTYRRLDGGAGTSFYVKESGTGNTGWTAK